MKNNLFMDGTKLFRHVEELAAWKRGDWFAPLHMEISLTNVCNQHCTFCYIDWSHGKIQMNSSTVCQLVRDAKKIGIKSALIAGEGEPTVNKAYLDAIDTAGEVGLDIALNTNLVHVTSEEIQRFLPKLSWMRVSFQSPNKSSYAAIHRCPEFHFDKAVNNIKEAVRRKKQDNLEVKIGIQQVLIDENGGTVFDLASLAKELGVDYWVVKPCHPHDLNKSGFKTIGDLVEKFKDQLIRAEKLTDSNFRAEVRWNFLKEAEQPRSYKQCLGVPFIIQITSDGGVYTCYPLSNKEEHCYGNLNEQGIEKILKSQKFIDTVNYVENKVDVSKCMPTCRQHNVNKYLWELREETPLHVNFI